MLCFVSTHRVQHIVNNIPLEYFDDVEFKKSFVSIIFFLLNMLTVFWGNFFWRRTSRNWKKSKTIFRAQNLQSKIVKNFRSERKCKWTFLFKYSVTIIFLYQAASLQKIVGCHNEEENLHSSAETPLLATYHWTYDNFFKTQTIGTWKKKNTRFFLYLCLQVTVKRRRILNAASLAYQLGSQVVPDVGQSMTYSPDQPVRFERKLFTLNGFILQGRL